MWWLIGIVHQTPASSSPRVRIRYIQQTGRVHCIILSTSQGRLGNVPENIRYTAVHGRKCFILQNYLHFLSIILSLFSLSSLPFSTGTLCLPPLHTSSPSLHSLPSLPSLPLPPSFSSLHSRPRIPSLPPSLHPSLAPSLHSSLNPFLRLEILALPPGPVILSPSPPYWKDLHSNYLNKENHILKERIRAALLKK